MKIAEKAHAGQIDKAGCKYINHPIHVADSVNTEDDKIVAYLHNVVEDTSMTIEDLANEGFSKTIILAIDTIAKKKNESYEEYVKKNSKKSSCKKSENSRFKT